MAKISKIIALIFVSSICYETINAKKDEKKDSKNVKKEPKKEQKKDKPVSVSIDYPEVKEMIDFAFGTDVTNKDMEFVEGTRKGTNPNFVYNLKVKIIDKFECTEDNNPETNSQIIKTEEECQVLP